MLPARTWRVHAVGIAPTDGKKSTTSLSLFMETFGLEVEEELCTMATSVLGRGSLDRKKGIMNKEKRG